MSSFSENFQTGEMATAPRYKAIRKFHYHLSYSRHVAFYYLRSPTALGQCSSARPQQGPALKNLLTGSDPVRLLLGM